MYFKLLEKVVQLCASTGADSSGNRKRKCLCECRPELLIGLTIIRRGMCR